MKKVIVILGPTGVGKTKLSLLIAKKINGEIISGDSIQIYKGLDIGSAKIMPDEMENIPHHLLSILSPGDDFSVAEFQRLVREKIASIEHPIIVGGTGLYIDAAIKNYSFAEQRDSSFDEQYANLSNIELYEYLLSLDPKATHLHPNNRKRVLRALEVFKKTGESITNSNAKHEYVYDALVLCLSLPREKLYERINIRVDKMFDDGLIDEVYPYYQKNIYLDGIGYKELYPYFDKKISLDEAKEEIKKNSRHYAKRQMTWFNHQDEFHLLDASNFDTLSIEATSLVEEFLKER